MARRLTLDQITGHLAGLGLQHNPIERIVHHRDGRTTVYLTSLPSPVTIPGAPGRTGAEESAGATT